MNHVTLDELPEDFQQLLVDLYDDYKLGEVPRLIPVELCELESFRGQVLADMEHFSLLDFQIMNEFVDVIIDDVGTLPPIIREGNLLHDGTHRTAAAFLAGETHLQCINLGGYDD